LANSFYNLLGISDLGRAAGFSHPPVAKRTKAQGHYHKKVKEIKAHAL